jgi:hypothetical protein
MKGLAFAFGLLFALAALLSLAASLLVTASLFIPGRSPESPEFLGISLVASGVFAGLCLLLAGIVVQVLALVRIAAGMAHETAAPLRRRLSRLLALFTIAGLCLCALLALIAYAVLARIDQGFAIFG